MRIAVEPLIGCYGGNRMSLPDYLLEDDTIGERCPEHPDEWLPCYSCKVDAEMEAAEAWAEMDR